jgi:signal transduction histidine kinase
VGSNTATTDALIHAAHVVAARGMFGMLWLSPDLVVETAFGELAGFVAIGQPVSDSVLALYGLDSEIKAQQSPPHAVLDYPNLALHFAGIATPKMNVSVFWLPDRARHLVLLGRILSRSDIEQELSEQSRRRIMAEALVAEKSAEIERANEELTRANRDLAEFAYVISHDLKAPMRALRFIADDLERSLDAPECDEPKVHLALMRQQSQRMSMMLSGLLAYSKVGRKEELIETIDTRALLVSVVASLRIPPAFRVSIEGEWPVAETLSAPLDLVLRNLIDNAVKHHDLPSGMIRVSATTTERRLDIEVADDGPGIELRYQSAVFQPFVRLNADEQVDSSGIGLSLVRKTIETAGGSLVLISDPATRRGTTFRIGWPVAKPT